MMSGSTSALGDSIRAAIAADDNTITYYQEAMSNGTAASLSGSLSASTYLYLDTVAGTTPDSTLFVPGNVSYLENVNDTNTIIGGAADTTQNLEVYQGDTAGQTFFAGSGNVDALFTGYGNVFAADGGASSTYVVDAGLVGSATGSPGVSFDNQDLAAAPTTQIGNTVAIASGNASIAAGLGYNSIFLGSGTADVASEGHDFIQGGTGDATIDGAGQATIFAGSGSTDYVGNGGSALIFGSGDSAGGGLLSVLGGTGAVTVFGGTGSLTAFGGSAGGNLLVGGTGNSVLVGAGSSDTLIASGVGTTALVAGDGNDTLFGGTGGTTNMYLGAGNDVVNAGTGMEYIQFGAGASTVFGGGGQDVYGVLSADSGTNVVVGFDASKDFISLQGFDASVTGSTVLASDVTVSGGNTILTIPTSGFTIEFVGVTNLSASNFG